MSKISDIYQKLHDFVRYDIWRITVSELSHGKRILYNIIKTLYLAIRGYYTNRLGVRAAALTYSITFAVVPIIALITAIGKGFGIETYIEKALSDTFIAQANMLPTVMNFVEKYLATTQGGIFIGIGLAILVYAVMNFFMQVENAFNTIWQVKKSRSIIRQFTILFSGLFILPILIVVTSGLSIYFNTILSQSFLYQFFSPLLKIVVFFVPFIISWIMFTFMYWVIPNTKVRFVNALIAGIVAGTAYQIFQMLYVNGQINLTRYNAVYGGFAAIPLLLLWINISCLIVLLGAEISYASQNLRYYDYEVDTDNISARYKKYLTVFVTYLIVKRFEQSKPPIKVQEIIKEYRLPIRLLNQVLQILTDANIIIEVADDDLNDRAYYPAMDINQLTINVLYSKIDKKGSELFLNNKSEEMETIWNKMLNMQLEIDTVRENILIKDLY
ncbi:Ribonuclease BN [uncultured Paludibacter sp.]|nr:Ribonuclease BN [uncultured Paludibacter sp.]